MQYIPVQPKKESASENSSSKTHCMGKEPLLGKLKGKIPREALLCSFDHINKPHLSDPSRLVATIVKKLTLWVPSKLWIPTALVLAKSKNQMPRCPWNKDRVSQYSYKSALPPECIFSVLFPIAWACFMACIFWV